ncbi:hypothetical protein AM1_2747 [Acaryochloris marina MBIC11017]|uniref:Uncharacterized protein n=1 Tax=Acaryochloris marina (strain MBIC 11017) TaxID=329726 RepID=B0C966_ACAM1|nr:hypothetical protein AM1_2747 [Acaryochloris marina MBIC11017]
MGASEYRIGGEIHFLQVYPEISRFLRCLTFLQTDHKSLKNCDRILWDLN